MNNSSYHVTDKVTSRKKSLKMLVIRPVMKRITPVVEGNTVTVMLDEPRKISIEPHALEDLS